MNMNIPKRKRNSKPNKPNGMASFDMPTTKMKKFPKSKCFEWCGLKSYTITNIVFLLHESRITEEEVIASDSPEYFAATQANITHLPQLPQALNTNTSGM